MLKKYQAVFSSRWKALWWAAGVCLTAYCTVPSADQSDVQSTKLHAKHASPWSVDKKS